MRENYEEAFRWFTRAAMRGNHEAAALLARCFMEGKGTSRDPEQALRWARRAAEGGDREGALLLETLSGKTGTGNASRANGLLPDKNGFGKEGAAGE